MESDEQEPLKLPSEHKLNVCMRDVRARVPSEFPSVRMSFI